MLLRYQNITRLFKIGWVITHHALEQFNPSLICCTVVPIRLLTVVTDSKFSFADGKLLTRIWNATVISDPPDLLCVLELLDAPSPPCSPCPSGDTVNPDGSRGIYDGSSPLMAMLMAGRSTGQYTTRDPEESMQLSCSITMLFWLVLNAYPHMAQIVNHNLILLQFKNNSFHYLATAEIHRFIWLTWNPHVRLLWLNLNHRIACTYMYELQFKIV